MTSTESDVQTLVTEEMHTARGVWGPETVSPPVSESDIRKWAIALYWPEVPPRQFWDQDFARTSRYGGIVAPEEFNPFSWRVADHTGNESAGARPGETPKKGGNVLNGGQHDYFYTRMRPGDVIRSRSRLSHWEERTGRNGLTLYVYSETEWRNQRGELVKRRISTSIRY
jgi:hypothetical protein